MRRHVARAALAFVLLSGAAAAQAPTVDDIVARNLQARGGADKLQAVNSVRMSGKITAQGREVPMTIYTKRPNLKRQDMTVDNLKMVQAFDGTTAWFLNPMMSETAQQAPASVATMMKEDDFDSPLLNYKNKGKTVELVGTEKVGGKDAYHLKITTKSGLSQDYYVDAQTGLEMKTVANVQGPAGKQTVETELSDFKQVDGITLPHSIRQSINGNPVAQMTIEKVEFNAPLDDALFRMPKQ
jgi:outer membrane lipoprotein-sorting protein